MTELGDEVARRKLVVDEALMASEPNHEEHESPRLRTFVRQLQLVADECTLFDIAVIEYWRARTQRVRWERHGDVTPDVMDTYDRRLQGEWRHAHAVMRARVRAETDGAAQSGGTRPVRRAAAALDRTDPTGLP